MSSVNVCDKCGKQIFASLADFWSVTINKGFIYDFCPACWKEFKKWLKTK